MLLTKRLLKNEDRYNKVAVDFATEKADLKAEVSKLLAEKEAL